MARQKEEPNRVDDLLDKLLEAYSSPENSLGQSGLMSQIKKRLVERALASELSHHLKVEKPDEKPSNSRNGSSKKTVTVVTPKVRTAARESNLESIGGKHYGKQAKKLQQRI